MRFKVDENLQAGGLTETERAEVVVGWAVGSVFVEEREEFGLLARLAV